MLDGFKKIINEDVSPRVRQILKLPSSPLAGLNCAMAQDLAAPAFLAARAAAVASFVDDPRMLAFMGITSEPLRHAGPWQLRPLRSLLTPQMVVGASRL